MYYVLGVINNEPTHEEGRREGRGGGGGLIWANAYMYANVLVIGWRHKIAYRGFGGGGGGGVKVLKKMRTLIKRWHLNFYLFKKQHANYFMEQNRRRLPLLTRQASKKQ